jgi:hypothetical protein
MGSVLIRRRKRKDATGKELLVFIEREREQTTI